MGAIAVRCHWLLADSWNLPRAASVDGARAEADGLRTARPSIGGGHLSLRVRPGARRAAHGL